MATTVTFFLALILFLFCVPSDANVILHRPSPPVGSVITTFTFQNDTGSTMPAGTPVSFGQGFRYDDLTPGMYPLIRDTATHTPLAGQQWDEVSTWRENGGDGSWRHAVWAAWLPADLAAGATYQVEFVSRAGNYFEPSHQPLTGLCSGPAAHDLKIHLTDVRGMDDTVRDSGDATFDVCSNIANTGRDAPRHLRSGNVYDEYEVSGMFVYATSGHQDPLLYGQCIVDIFTKTDGASPGDVRWVCHVHNSWMNVAAGSAGNAGNPGPAGFANDPQTITYRAEVDDGASDVLDWSGLDATVTSASNPIQPNATAGCDTTAGSYCMFVASSTGANQWYYGQATRVSTTNTPVAGLMSGSLYFVYPGSSVASNNATTTGVILMQSPYDVNGGANYLMTASQGTGTTTFSTRIPHYHWSTWQTLDWTGLPNWSPFGTTSRVTRKLYPAFTAAEKLYWEETGLIIPLNLSQTTNVGVAYRQALGPNYEPFGRLDVIGFQGPSSRPDLGISNEFAAQAFITGAQGDWDNAHLFTLGASTHGYATLLNEATGRIPPLNNGPPIGAGGNGTGGSYAGLGAPWPGVDLNWGGACGSATPDGLANTPHNLPNSTYPWDRGQWLCGTYISHMPSFNGFTYEVFGDRNLLDAMRWHANQDYLQQRPGPGPELGQGYYRDNNAVFTDGNTYHYYGLLIDCCQTRGSAWLIRDVTYAATFGGDADVERSVFDDMLTENRNYHPMWLKWKDGPGNSNYSTSITLPNAPGLGVVEDTFIGSYVAASAWLQTVFLHEPLGSTWMSKFQRFYEGVLGRQLPGAPVSFYGIDFISQPEFHNGDDGGITPQGGNFGPSVNGTDASDFGAFSPYTNVLTGGQLSALSYVFTPGDFLKPMTAVPAVNTQPLDQLSGLVWYQILGPVNNSVAPATFYLQCPIGHAVTSTCPTPGAAFTGFTRGGVPVVNELNYEQFKFRPQHDPGAGAGYADLNYVQYGGQTLSALKILGYSVPNALADYASRAADGYYNPGLPSNWWDQTVVIPGLPEAVDGLALTLSPSALNFPAGTIGVTGAPITITVTNISIGPVTVSSISLSGANAADFGQSSDCLRTLAPGSTCHVNVTWTPASASPESGVVSVNTSGYDYTAALNGAGSAPSLTLVVTPSAPTIPSSYGTIGNVAGLQGVWFDASSFTGSYVFAAPNYDVNGTYAVSGSELIVNPNGPGVGGAGGTVQHPTMEAVQLAPTADGITSTAPSGSPLVNSAGYWSWSGRQLFGNTVLYLNGQQHAPSDAATLIEVDNGGQLFAFTTSGWYVWNGTTFVSSSGPGSVPAQAAAAGFTTPVISSDFTTPAYANTSTWLDCAGAGSPIWWQGNGFPIGSFNPFGSPCPTIANDSGTQVLQITVLASQANSDNGITSGKGTTTGVAFPVSSFYSEGVMRFTPNQTNAFVNGPWVAVFNGSSLEYDSFENTGPGIFADAAFHNGGQGQAIWSPNIPHPPPGYDITQYHTYGFRVTTDASTGIYSCSWIDDVFQACLTTNTTSGATVTAAQITTTPGLVNIFTGVSTAGNTSVASNLNAYVKRMTVWSCSNWQSANQVACKTSVLDPGGY